MSLIHAVVSHFRLFLGVYVSLYLKITTRGQVVRRYGLPAPWVLKTTLLVHHIVCRLGGVQFFDVDVARTAHLVSLLLIDALRVSLKGILDRLQSPVEIGRW